MGISGFSQGNSMISSKRESVSINIRPKIILVSLCALLVIYFLYQLLYSGRVLPRVFLADTTLSGKKLTDLETLVERRLQSFAEKPLIFTIEGKQIESTLEALGITFDPKQTSA